MQLVIMKKLGKVLKMVFARIAEITNYDKELPRVKIAGEVKDFNPADYLEKAIRK